MYLLGYVCPKAVFFLFQRKIFAGLKIFERSDYLEGVIEKRKSEERKQEM